MKIDMKILGGGTNLKDLGFTKVSFGSFTKTNDTHIRGTKIEHELGTIPKCVIIFTEETDMEKFNDNTSYYEYTHNLIHTGDVSAECGATTTKFGYAPAPIKDTEKGLKVVFDNTLVTIAYNHSNYGNAYVGWRKGIEYKWLVMA